MTTWISASMIVFFSLAFCGSWWLQSRSRMAVDAVGVMCWSFVLVMSLGGWL